MDLVLVLDQLYTFLFYPNYINTENTMSKFLAAGATLQLSKPFALKG
jgi:hypothetical protein